MLTIDNTDNSFYQQFPRSVMWASRQEFPNKLELEVIEGQLPELYGHAFFIGPVGSVDQKQNEVFRPSEDGTPLFNGDAMIYRLDFDRVKENRVNLTSKIAKTPCFYADKATLKNEYKSLKYNNLGLARLSFSLGFRNQVNTAFLPMKFSEQEGYRLLVTWDAGRPYEIDTKSLDVLTPIGGNKDWVEQIPLSLPFEVVNTAAHPVFDSKDKSLYTINYGKSIANWLSRPGKSVDELQQELGYIEATLGSFKRELQRHENNRDLQEIEIEEPSLLERELPPQYQEILQEFRSYIQESSRLPLTNDIKWLSEIVEILKGIRNLVNAAKQMKDFVKLIRWDGQSDKFDIWEIMILEGEKTVPISIKETMHQIAVTQDYIILMDTVFKVGPEQLLTNIFPTKEEYGGLNCFLNKLNKLLRNFLSYQQLNDTFIYVINRSDLNPSKACVIAKKVKIELSAAHFQADYENPNSKITLHMAHNEAWDASDWIRSSDEPQITLQSPLDLPVGMSPDGMDLNSLGKYEIDMSTDSGEPSLTKTKDDLKYTWMTAIAAYNSVDGIKLPQKFKNIYWISWGFWSDLLTKHTVELYTQFEDRQIPVPEVLQFSQSGIPASLCRLDVETMEIDDKNGCYSFPANVFGNSPQFVPRQQSESNLKVDESMNGYIICVVNTGNDGNTPSEFWIFGGANLKQGPVCKLADKSKKLKLGMTIHSTWLPEIGERKATYNIPVRQDYEERVQIQPAVVKQLFEHEVYPHFP